MIKNLKRLIVFVIAVTLALGLIACGSGQGTEAPDGETAAALEPATVEEAIPDADTGSSPDILIGSWKGISDPDSFANITKTEAGYQYEDNDDVYEAAFAEGKLKIRVSEDAADIAEAYVDTETGNLLVLYQGGLSKFEKK